MASSVMEKKLKINKKKPSIYERSVVSHVSDVSSPAKKSA